jgi:hypothetical protein
MKKLLSLAFMGVFAFGALTLSSCDKGGEDGGPTPVITITAHPATPTAVTEGSITGSLTVAASVTENATLTYQWYGNTSASNTGGTAISGATSASFAIPATLTEGTYHYFCEVSAKGATAKRSNAATVTVSAPIPVKTVSVGTQTGTLTAGTAGVVTYEVTTANIAAGEYDATVANLPPGVTAGNGGKVTIAANGNGTLTLSGSTATLQGTTSTLTLKIDDTTSAAFTLTVGAVVGPTLVTATALTGVTAPAANATPSTAINNGTGFTAALEWVGNPAVFGYETVYTAKITLTAASGYTFNGGFANTAQITGFKVTGIAPVWTSNGGTTLVFTVTFTATAAAPILTYTIEASPLTSFGSFQAPYTQPEPQTVTITNTGTGAVTLTQPAATNYTLGTLSKTEITAGATATFTVQPKANLAAGTYNENIAITGTNGATTSVSAQFTVIAPAPTYTISASSLTPFGSLQTPYTQPEPQTVTITNTGTGAVTLTQPAATDYLIGALSTTDLAAGAAATFTVQPKANLAEGVHDEQITINGSGGATTSVTARFTVTAPEPSFVAVTNITGVPTAAIAETPLTLTGTVDPTTATNKTIVWSVKSAGATGATIAGGNALVTTAAGTVTVTATIVNGMTATTDYTQDFNIDVTAPEPGDDIDFGGENEEEW